MKRKTPLKRGLSQLRRSPLRRTTELGRSPLKRSPLLRKTGDAYHFRKRKKIPAMSQKRKKEGAEYSKLRLQFLKDHPLCQCCSVRPATEVHHKGGRGRFLLRVDTWLASCQSCHADITADRRWAESKGLSLTIAQRRALP